MRIKNYGSLCFQRIGPLHLSCKICGCRIIQSIPLLSPLCLQSPVRIPFVSHLTFIVCDFFGESVFLWQFYLAFQRTSSLFYWFFSIVYLFWFYFSLFLFNLLFPSFCFLCTYSVLYFPESFCKNLDYWYWPFILTFYFF